MFVGLLLLYENFLKQNMVYSMLYMALISLIYLTFAIKLVCCYFRIYNSFKKSFDDKLHSETKQILSYIAMFAVVFTLASINFITFLSGYEFMSFLLFVATVYMGDIFVIVYLVLIHMQNFSQQASSEIISI